MATKTIYKVQGEQGAAFELLDVDGALSLSLDGTVVTAVETLRSVDASAKMVSVTAATLTVTEASHAGKLIALNRAAGIAVTLPAATGTGNTYEFVVGTSVTSNTTTIKVADATDVMDGIVYAADDTATPAPLVWVTAPDSDTITLNGSTQGGIIGDRIKLTDIATDQWVVHGFVKQSGVEATPFSASV